MASGGRLHVILLSGGSGTRLWPLSTPGRPKQFLQVLTDDEGRRESMVQRTARLLGAHVRPDSITVATSEDQRALLEDQLDCPLLLSLEPERRDTAPAIMLAAARLAGSANADADDAVVVLPIDAHADASYYERIRDVRDAVERDVADLVLMGVMPTGPSSRFGYIVPEPATQGAVRPVARFQEKPAEDEARLLIAAGALWNCGVFGFRLGYALDLARKYVDDVTYEGLRAAYGMLPQRSFDYEVTERARSVAVVTHDGAWDDLGTWDALARRIADPHTGRTFVDEATTKRVCALNETEVPLVVCGVSDAVVVVTDEGILVCGAEGAARVADLVREAMRAPEPMHATEESEEAGS